MTINYTNLFTNAGKYVKIINRYKALYTGFDTDYSGVASVLETSGRDDLLSGQFQQFEGFKNGILGWIQQLRSQQSRVMTNREAVLVELPVGSSSDLNTVLKLLYADMITNAQNVLKSTITLSAVTASKTNANAGICVVDKVLDGYSPPSPGWPAIKGYAGENSQVGLTDTHFLTCTSDLPTDGVPDGSESFTWIGKPNPGDPYSYRSYGSGSGPTVRTLQGNSLLSNLEFETFSSNAPGSWTLDSGTAGTHVFSDTTGAKVKRGTYSLKLTGDAAATITLSQAAATLVKPYKRYVVGFWVLGNAAMATGTLTISFTSASGGYTAGATEKVSMNAAAIQAATAYVWKSFYVNMPADIPTDLKLTISLTGPATNAQSLWIDGGGFQAVDWFNGHSTYVYAGSDNFVRGDNFTYTCTNDEAGVFQTAFAKLFRIQFPSVAAAPTIAEALAT